MEQAVLKDALRQLLESHLPGVIVHSDDFRGQQSITIKPQSLPDVGRVLLSDREIGLHLLSDITCIDWIDHEMAAEGRFEVVYNLYSIKNAFRLLLKVRLDGDKPMVASLTSLWAGANWLEREVYDLFGIHFAGHPDLRKILTPDDLEGHPLRRDFPLTWEQPVFSWNKNEPPEVIR